VWHLTELDLKHELTLLLEKEIGFTGKFILEKQCKNLNLDFTSINSKDLTSLANQICIALRGYIGERRAEEIKKGILDYRNALETVAGKEASQDDIAYLIEAQITIADNKQAIGMLKDAEAALREARTLLAKCNENERNALEAKVSRHLARVLSREKASMRDAEAEYEKAVKLGEDAGQHYDVALSWSGLGAISWRAGHHKKALEFYNNALKEIDRIHAEARKDKVNKMNAEAIIKSGLGNVYLDLLDADRAIRNCEEAIIIFKELGDWAEVGRVFNNLARVYEEMGKFELAIDKYERGIRHSKEAGELRMEGWTLTNLASTLIEENKVSEALPHLERAEKLLANFKDPVAHSKLHCMWGKYFREKGDWKASIEHFTKSMEFVKEENAPDYLATAEEEFGIMYLKKGDKDNALTLLNSALAWYKKKGETTHMEKILKNLKQVRQGK
jgi:G-protein signaling modulator 2